MIKLYANIGMGHENDWQTIKSRVVAAAQCNADAIVMTKSTPRIAIPENKKYVGIESKWGYLPYLEVAEKSEIDDLNVSRFNKLVEQIGIPVIWCVTDIDAADWVITNTSNRDCKIHYDSRNDLTLIDFVFNNFNTVKYCGSDENVDLLYSKYNRTQRETKLSIYHTADKFPTTIEALNLSRIEELKNKYPHASIGYEGRCEDIYPDCAVVLKNVDYVEKYLGDEEEFNSAVLTHQKFYDFFINMNQLEVANG